MCIYIYFTRFFFCPLFQNKAMYIYIYIFAGQCSDSEGQFAWPAWWIEFTSRFILKSFKGYECDPWSTTQVETSQVETSVVGVYRERVFENSRRKTFVLAMCNYMRNILVAIVGRSIMFCTAPNLTTSTWQREKPRTELSKEV